MGYSAPLAPTVKMRTLLAFAVALAASSAFELTKTNNGGNVIMFMPEEEVDYNTISSVSQEHDNDVYASAAYDSIDRYSVFDGTVYNTDSYDGDFNDDNTSDDGTDIYEAEGLSLDEEGREGEHALHRRSPQDPNALYQFPGFKIGGKLFKKAGKKMKKLSLKLPLIGLKMGKKLGKKGKKIGKRSAMPLLKQIKGKVKGKLIGAKMGLKLGKVGKKTSKKLGKMTFK